MVEPQVYIGTTRLDLYPDETITISASRKSLLDPDKVRVDYSNSFTIPASKTNNAVMKHWWNSDISSGVFNPNLKKAATIQINGSDFRTGYIKVEDAKVKNGRPESYSLTFYQDGISLNEIFGEDTLADLDLSAFATAYTSFGSAIDGTVLSGDVCIPLIGTERQLKYNPDGNDNLATLGGYYQYEFKPAISLDALLGAIQTKYGITFTGFFGTAPASDIFVWAHNNTGRSNSFEYKFQEVVDPSAIETGTSASSIQWDAGTEEVVLPVGAGSYDTTVTVAGVNFDGTLSYELIVYDVNASAEYLSYDAVDTSSFEFTIGSGASERRLKYGFKFNYPVLADAIGIAHIESGVAAISLVISSSTFTSDIGSFNFNDKTFTDSFTGETVSVPGGMPAMKVKEFLIGLVKMFNLVIENTTPTTYNFTTYNTWIAAGDTVDLTKYVHDDEYSVKPSRVFGAINFMYKDPVYGQGVNYKDNYFVGYGDLETEIVDTSGDLISPDIFEVKIPFENMVFTKLGTSTNLITADAVDESGSPKVGGLVLFYRTSSSADTFFTNPYYKEAITGNDTHTTYNLCYQWDASATPFNYSLNWGAQTNPYTGEADGASDPSLYNTFWSDFITERYDTQARIYKFKARLPVGIMLTLSLNDTIVISRRSYRIVEYSANIVTGQAMFTLTNIVD